MSFNDNALDASHAVTTSLASLSSRWGDINATSPTDIIYVGKADSLRKRVRSLALFGVGRRHNHRGGEWMWQIAGVEQAGLLLQTCPVGHQVGFENAFLRRFGAEHGDWPLANRSGPRGIDYWWPAEMS